MALVKGIIPETPQFWALFDLDWTVIRPLKRAIYEYSVGWAWLPYRKETLSQLEKNGFRIGFITNQSPWAKQSLENIDLRLTEVYSDLSRFLNNPIILAGTTDPNYRKPAPGWTQFLKFSDKSKSFFCGDAAGRPDDFSDSDLQFAKNSGLTFYLPEQIFPITNIPGQIYTTARFFLILVGVQGSGKTTFASQLESHGWIRISSDSYGSSKPRIQKALTNAMSLGKSVVLDATNPTRSGRAEYIALGESRSYSVAIVHLLNPGAERNKRRDHPVPKIAVDTYWSRLENPIYELDHVPVYELL